MLASLQIIKKRYFTSNEKDGQPPNGLPFNSSGRLAGFEHFRRVIMALQSEITKYYLEKC
jgi:hypothetical protein